ncbi:hypothetical protein HAX54_023056, partial [Datura stramonium]|nr:hypothetical protein [Datura stramonium]
MAFSRNNNRVYSIKHPTVNSVMDKFLVVICPPNTDIRNPLIEPHQNANVGEVNKELIQMEGLIEAEQKHGETLQVMDIECPYKFPQVFHNFLFKWLFKVKISSLIKNILCYEFIVFITFNCIIIDEFNNLRLQELSETLKS